MDNSKTMFKMDLRPAKGMSPKSKIIWRTLQVVLWLVGVAIFVNLVLWPNVGIHLFWNILIPIAPLLLVVGVGIWRNVCPMASTALFPRHKGFSKRKALNAQQIAKCNLIGIVALFILVPLRHTVFDLNGMATAILLLSLAVIAFIVGTRYEWKSAWCSGLCPIYPVEKLYGPKSKLTLPNAHCGECHKCVTPCPDSTPGIHPMSVKKSNYDKISGLLMVGAFPGFVWGWFQVPDHTGSIVWEQLVTTYAWPIIGLLFTMVLFSGLKQIVKKEVLISIFSAAAVSCYYWYRIPALFGYGKFPGDGMLIDLTAVIPAWSLTTLALTMTLFFFWWIVLSKSTNKSWTVRPLYAEGLVKSRKK